MSEVIKCIIFDCDGTLVDSEYLGNLALEIKLAELGVTESAETLTQKYRGWKLARIFAMLEREHQITLNETAYRQLLAELFTKNLKPIPDAKTALSQIHLPKCVASSGPPEKIEQSLRLTGLRGFFGPYIYSAYTVQSWKPEPDLFLHAARAMGVSPAHCAVVEDSEVGLMAATRAGMQPYFYNSDHLACRFSEVISFSHMGQLPAFFPSGSPF